MGKYRVVIDVKGGEQYISRHATKKEAFAEARRGWRGHGPMAEAASVYAPTGELLARWCWDGDPEVDGQWLQVEV